MSTQVQWKRGTTAQNNSYTGAVGEITVDTNLKQLRLHDGATQGGIAIQGSTVAVNSATNLSAGTAGQIPYQTGPNLTAFFGPGNAGQVLVSNGTSAPGYQSTLTLAGTTTATSTTTGALIVGGGVGIGGNLYVGGEIVANRLTIQLTTVTTTLVQTDDIIQTLNTTQSNSTITGALQVAGGAGIGRDVTVGGSIRSSGVVTATTFIGNLTGNITGAGTGNILYQSANNVTSFLSTGTAGQLLMSAAGAPAFTNTASIYVNSSVYAEDIRAGTAGQLLYQSAPNVTDFLSTATTGNFLQANFAGAPTWTTTASMYVNDAVVSTNLRSGSAGGIPYQTAANVTTFLGIGTNGFVLSSNGSAPTWTALSGLSTGLATTATNLAGGTVGQIPYQTAAGLTSFLGAGTAGQILVSAGAAAPTYTNTGSIYVNSSVYAEEIRGGTAGQLHYQSAPNVTDFISTATTGNFLQANFAGAPTWTTTASMYVGNSVISTNIRAGTIGQLHYQSAADTTGFVGPGTAGQLLMSAGAAIPVYTNTASIYVNSAVNAQTLFGGTAGQLHYQSAPGVTAFMGPGTAGQILVSAGAAVPVYTNTSSIQVGFAANLLGGAAGSIPIQGAGNSTVFLPIGTTGYILQSNGSTASWVSPSLVPVTTATNLGGGTAGQVPYQTAAGLTSFYGPGTAGQLLMSAGAAAPAYTNTASIYVGAATSAVNLFAGTAGQLHYQSAPGVTAFMGPGTAGQILVSNGAAAPVYTNTGSIYVGNATQVNTVAQPVSANYFLTFVDTNNAASSAESVYTTSSFYINPASGATNLQSLSVNSLSADTGTKTSNSLYVAGGAWIDKTLLVAGDTTFRGNVIFQGTNTFVYSSSTVYTDNLISLHAPSGSTPGSHTWTIDDGKDVGFMFHYYKGADKDAFLGFANDTSYLEWYDNGVESGGIFTGTSYGTFKTGAIKLAGGTANTGNTSSGDLTVLGGVGIGQNLYVAGSITVAGSINATVNGTITTATNVAGGTAGQLHYQSAPGVTAFAGPGTFGQFLMSTGAAAPVYQSTLTQANGNILVTSNTAVSTTNSGALQVVNGGLGVGGGGFFGGTVTSTNHIITGNTNASSTITGALQVVGGVGIGGNIYFNGNLYQNGVLFTSGSTSTTSTFTINNNTQATSTQTGALQVVNGGFGLGGNFYSGGTIVNINGTNATSTTTGALQIINGGAGIGRDLWVGGSIYTAGAKLLPTAIQEFTATGGQTTFTVTGGYTVGSVQVYANGIQLANADFTASNGTTVVLTTPRVSGDIIRTVAGLTSSSINNINALAIAYSVAFGG